LRGKEDFRRRFDGLESEISTESRRPLSVEWQDGLFGMSGAGDLGLLSNASVELSNGAVSWEGLKEMSTDTTWVVWYPTLTCPCGNCPPLGRSCCQQECLSHDRR